MLSADFQNDSLGYPLSEDELAAIATRIERGEQNIFPEAHVLAVSKQLHDVGHFVKHHLRLYLLVGALLLAVMIAVIVKSFLVFTA